MTLNERAWQIADRLAAEAELLRIGVHTVGGARVLDCGINAPGGLQAGLGLARACLADPRVTKARVRVEKPLALQPDAVAAGVELTVVRD